MLKKLLTSVFLSAVMSLGSVSIANAETLSSQSNSDSFMISSAPEKDSTETDVKKKKKKKKKSDEKMSANTGKDAKDININTASETELKKINGIGDSLARNIVKYRTDNGKFKSVDDLKNVKGIGEKGLAKIKPQVII